MRSRRIPTLTRTRPPEGILFVSDRKTGKATTHTTRWWRQSESPLLAKDARDGAPRCCSISSALRGAEAPLFHGTPSVWGLPSATSRSGSTSKTLAPNHPCPCGSDTLVRCRAEHADSPYESACAVEGSLHSRPDPNRPREFSRCRWVRPGRARVHWCHIGVQPGLRLQQLT